MLYKKNKTSELDIELFKNPTSEYRGAPFWAWNCDLDKEELLRQIECLKEMGMGGFHIHTRSGMSTPYLSDEFMQYVKACVDKGKSEEMLTWLYDEDRYPSGTAGGKVTKNPAFRSRRLRFTTHRIDKVKPMEKALESGDIYLVGVYDIILNSSGELEEYKKISEDEKVKGTKWFAYSVINPPITPGWFNGEVYVDTLNEKAISRFIEITHEKYKKVVGDDFGTAIPAIFTDEPQFPHKKVLPSALSHNDVDLPWTSDFDETYKKEYGFSIVEKLPELFWELPLKKVSKARYFYHDQICERFTRSFADTCGKWCSENSLYLTGHMMEETTLKRQTAAIGEAMRAYRSFELPGVDVLCNFMELDTVKQAQSASRQLGREGVMAELYGVTNWDFDFRGHKSQGDWLAAMGVSVRVHHLSLVSMKGAAKRDYPASINYQSPWYKEYSYIEDYFSRINVVMTRGKSCVNVGIIHPVESYWLHWGPDENTSEIRNHMENNFENIIKWLIYGTVDFDFICEANLPKSAGFVGEKLLVGEMGYSTIIVPECETLRNSTVKILNEFLDKGGKVIIVGNSPKYVDAEEKNEDISYLIEHSLHIPFNKLSILESLEAERDIEIRNSLGKRAEHFIYQMRKDGEEYNLFISNAQPYVDIYCNSTHDPLSAVIKVKGEFTPVKMDALCGKICDVDFEISDGSTFIYYDFYEHDSLLLKLKPAKIRNLKKEKEETELVEEVTFKEKVSYHREEENVCLLDIGRYALDDGKFYPEEEVLRIDCKLREELKWPLADGMDIQPWAIETEKITHSVMLCFYFNCECEIENTFFCGEELTKLELNGENVELRPSGYFVDKSIVKYALPTLKKGENRIILKVPFGKKLSIEPFYLVGNFNVIVEGCKKTLTKPSDMIGFGDIASQGLPFYGGNIKYNADISIKEKCDLSINAGYYKGALVKVCVDGKPVGNIVFAPYEIIVKNVECGTHTIEFELFGNRYNTFGALHNCGISRWYGPSYWYSTENSWCYEYNLKKMGILKSPVIKMLRKKTGSISS